MPVSTLSLVAPDEMDGRIARGARARAAIVDALLALIEAGELRPSAARIAERAGVSLRSVFQHFKDVESLFAAMADRQRERPHAGQRESARAGSAGDTEPRSS